MKMDNEIIMTQEIEDIFLENIETSQYGLDMLTPNIAIAAQLMADILLSERKVLSCGNGISSYISQMFASQLLDKYQRERPSLPAVALTQDGSAMLALCEHQNLSQVFSLPLQALAQEDDVLLVLSAEGNDDNVIQAVQAAHERSLHIVAITGHDGGQLSMILQPDDIELRIPSDHNARIHEHQLLIINCLCQLIDQHIFGD